MNTNLHLLPQTIQRLKHIQSLLDQLQPQAAPQAFVVPGSPQPQGIIIVFPGSFNPPTTAHLALLEQARQYAYTHLATSSTQLYAAISKRIVDKEHVERPLIFDRILLLQTVLQHHLPDTGILLFNRGLYVEQAQAVYASFPTVKKLFFLMGFDKIVQILDPHYYDDRDVALRELFKLAKLLVAPRGEAHANTLAELLNQPQNQPFASYIHTLPFDPAYRDISSTNIRQQSDRYTDDIPQEVQQFVQETHAYELPLHLADGTQIDYYGERVKALEKLLGEKPS